MRPISTSVYISDSGVAYAETLAECAPPDTGFAETQQVQNLALGELRSAMSGASADCSVRDLVIHVLGMCSPSKITGSIIRRVAVGVSNFVVGRWFGTVKRCTYKYSHLDSFIVWANPMTTFFVSVLTQYPASIETDYAFSGNLTSVERTDAPKARSLIARMFCDWFPYFWYSGVNHCALLKHGGQRFEASYSSFQASFYTIFGRAVSFPS